jgi:oxygen-independent coproporphyrinogen-3 oxidase
MLSEDKALYIHIPFCKSICAYCDFKKVYYNELWVSKYLRALEKEIRSKYKGEVIKTLYIGGGTPNCLSLKELEKLFSILKIFNFKENIEFTFECNIELINEDYLIFLKENKVNRLSIGLETTNEHLLTFLNRKHTKKEALEKFNLVKKYFDNISADLIYAIPGESLKDLENDLDFVLKLKLKHLSFYSLIIEKHTMLYINKVKNISEDLDYKMHSLINKKLKKYRHYEVSNYSIKGFESAHNLTYWDNQEYYGFGLGASGYIDKVRYTNISNLNDYMANNFKYEEHHLIKQDIMENEMMLGFRKKDGINVLDFKEKFAYDLTKNKVVLEMIKDKRLVLKKDNLYIRNLYVQNEIIMALIDSL